MNNLLKVSLLFFFSQGLLASEPDPLFLSSDVLDITITAPFSQIDRQRNKEIEYEGATIAYIDASGVAVELSLKLSVRGNNRLRKDVCNYSQLWVNLPKKKVEATIFENQNKIKLVVQCKNGPNYEDYLVKEEMAYRFFNQVSDYSLRTRVLNVTYVDSARKNKSRTHKAFFIEHQKRLASRLDMEVVKESEVTQGSLDNKQSNQLDVFMYMLGNTDYSTIMASEGSCCHNSKLLQDADGTNFPIPYDFDSSGFVDARYAKPNPNLGIRNNRQRLYRGFCQPAEVLSETISLFLARQESFNGLIAQANSINAKTSERALGFIDEFFKVLNNSKSINSAMREKCRGSVE